MEGVMEEREEFMVAATNSIPTKRKAHFLNPKAPASPTFKLPSLSPKCSWPMSVGFLGWRSPQKNWEAWIDQMQAKHGDLWKQVGIFEAIQVSKYKFKRNDELIHGFSERWCSDSNTFVFPWGEATLTLEDVLILGGFSVLGSPAVGLTCGADMEDAERELRAAPKTKRDHRNWLEHYMDSGSAIEHEAFLCYWISRFVIPGPEVDRIGDHVFSVAISLSRGVKVALAPTVLANTYRDLGLLKATMSLASSLEKKENNSLAVSIWAPLQFVQLWIWERFIVFRPKPNVLKSGDVRAARWRGLGRADIGNVRPVIDSCGYVFLWRPYCMKLDGWSFPEFYKEDEGYVQVLMCEKMQSYAWCLRGCVLAGTDGMEPYQPHRVALQFGLDQDLPSLMPRSVEAAHDEYMKPCSNDFKVYLPGRLFEGDLSLQYWNWWNDSVAVPVQPFPGLVKGRRTYKFVSLKSLIKIEPCALDVPPGFPRKAKEDPPIPLSMFAAPIKERPITTSRPRTYVRIRNLKD